MLRLTFEGFRIDEVLSVTLDSYDAIEQLVQPTRSKGRANARNGENKLRLVALPKKTCEVIDKYIQTERADAESESGKLSQYLFINLNSGKRQGLPMSYHNYLKILKRCATRAGLDAAKIRTHNGRSTKVMEFLEHQSLHPEDNITDGIIMESFGWRSFSSIDHYRNHNNPIIAKSVMEKLHRGGEEMSKAKPLTAEQCEAAREAMLTGHSLSKISRCAGVVATIEYMLKDIRLLETYLQRMASAITQKREQISHSALLLSMFHYEMSSLSLYDPAFKEMLLKAVEQERIIQRKLFVAGNSTEVTPYRDVWKLYEPYGNVLRLKRLDFTAIKRPSLRSEVKYYFCYLFEQRGKVYVPLLMRVSWQSTHLQILRRRSYILRI